MSLQKQQQRIEGLDSSSMKLVRCSASLTGCLCVCLFVCLFQTLGDRCDFTVVAYSNSGEKVRYSVDLYTD